MMRTHGKRSQGAFTLVELMMVVAVIAVLALVAGPSLRDMIDMQRLRSINAQLVTDMQFARSEAVSRQKYVRVYFRATPAMTCYSLYLAPTNANPRCDCSLGVGNACSVDPTTTELRTVQVQRSSGILLDAAAVVPPQYPHFAYDHITGGLVTIPSDKGSMPLDQFTVDVRLDDARRLRDVINITGRVTVCAPDPSRMQVPGCQ